MPRPGPFTPRSDPKRLITTATAKPTSPWYYDPTTAQFLTRDPMVAQTRSVYGYTNNSPLNATDPSGMCNSPECIGWYILWNGGAQDAWHGFANFAAGIADGALGAVTNGEAHWSAPYTGPGLDASYHAGQYTFVAETAIATFGAALGLSPCSEEATEAPETGGVIDDVHPSTPTGQKGSPMDVPKGTNSPTEIGGRQYGGHALDQMQGRGIPPSAVEDAITNGTPAPQTGGRIAHYSPENNITVITENGKVVTATYGKVSPR